MALITRYFSTGSFGAGDGTTWADRMPLTTGSGIWSPTITTFNYTGNGLMAVVESGVYCVNQTLAAGLFTGTPVSSSPLFFWGADATGGLLQPTSPGWTSDMPAFDYNQMPLITGSCSNFSTLLHTFWGLMRIRITGSVGGNMIGAGGFNWCVLEGCSNGGGSITVSTSNVYNSIVGFSGTQYSALGGAVNAFNTRFQGNPNATASNRNGLASLSTNFIDHCTIVDGFGNAVVMTAASTLKNCVIARNSGNAVVTNATTTTANVLNCMITDNSGFGILMTGRAFVSNNRFRDNRNGDFQSSLSYPSAEINNGTGYGNLIEGSVTDDYANPNGGSFQIKFGNAIAHSGFGVSQQFVQIGTVGSVAAPVQRNLPDIKVW